MKIILRLEDIGISLDENIKPGAIPDAIYEEVYSAVQTEYEDASQGSDAWLYDDSGDKDNFLFGLDSPDALKKIAAEWNSDIQKELARCIEKLTFQSPDEIQLDTSLTYDLSKAAREADGHFFPYAEHGVLVDNGCGYTYLRTIISEAYLKDIMNVPECYCVVTVYPK